MDGSGLTPQRQETLETLTGHARGRFGRIAPSRIAELLLHNMPDAEWSLLRAALDALARRYAFAKRDGLKLATRPARRALLGTYRTKSGNGEKRGTRPYDTDLLALTPLQTSCSCADFVRASLGLCKHGLVLLEALETEGAFTRTRAVKAEPNDAALRWNPHHPLRGAADRLERLHLVSRRALPGFQNGKPLARELRLPEQRLAAIKAIEKLIARGKVSAEPAVRTVLEEERQRAERGATATMALSETMKSLGSLHRKLYPYQRDGVRRLLEGGRLLLADDMGLGKTTQAIAACHALFNTKRVQRGLLIVPAALKGQWKREWDATTDVPAVVIEGSRQERARSYAQTRRGFVIIGYEQLLRDFEAVQRFDPELVVLDEAQRIKNWATKSAAYVKALAPRYRFVLTGTPMENRLAELASVMDFVDDLALEPKWRLTPYHTLAQGDGGAGLSGARNLDVLRERLAPVLLRRVRKDVLSQLPPRVDTRIPVELTSVQRDAHEDLRRPIAQLMQIAATRPLLQAEFLRLMTLLARQRMICNGMAQVQFELEWPRCQTQTATPEVLDSLFAPKLAVLRGLIEQVVIGQRRKAVVFSQWRNMLRFSEWAVRDLLEQAGLRAVFFTGAESAALRERSIVAFHDDPSVAVMFLSDAGGVGLNLQRAASCCINLELPWNPAVLEQRIGRIYRLGQTLPIDVYNLVSEGGIESRIATLVERKRAVFSGLFDGSSDEVVFQGDSSFMEGIKKLVDPVPVPLAAAEDSELPELQADGAAEVTDAAAPEATPALQPVPVSPGGLSIERQSDGSLRIAAPPALAAPLAELFEQLARSLRGTS